MSNFKVGDWVYARSVGGYSGYDIQTVRTIVRTTHNGTRCVLDNGKVFLARSGSEVGTNYIVWQHYTSEVQERWNLENRRKRIEAKLRDLGVAIHPKHMSGFSTDALERIADVIEQEIGRKDVTNESVH